MRTPLARLRSRRSSAFSLSTSGGTSRNWVSRFGYERNEVKEGSPKPIQFPNNEGVAKAEGSKGSIETAARRNAAAHNRH